MSKKSYEEIEKEYGYDALRGDAVAQFTGEEFMSLDGDITTTEVLVYVAGSSDDGFILMTQDQYADGELTTDGGTNQLGEIVYDSAAAARQVAQESSPTKGEEKRKNG